MQVVGLWIAVVVAATLACSVAVVPFLKKGERVSVVIVLLGLSAIGATAGITGGLSREGVVGDIMSAALGLLGGLVVWLFAADRSKGTIVSICAVTFSFSLFLGYFEGAARRASPESYLFWREQCLAKFTDKDLLNDPVAFAVMDRSIGALCGRVFNTENQDVVSP